MLALAALIFLSGVQALVGCGPASDLLRNAMDGLREHKRSCDSAAVANLLENVDTDALGGAGAGPSSRRPSIVLFKFQEKDGVASVVLQALVTRIAAAAEPPADFALVALRCPLEYDGENSGLLTVDSSTLRRAVTVA